MSKRIIAGIALTLLVLGMTLLVFNARPAKANGIVGDLDNDGDVDMADLLIAAQAFGSVPQSPRWNANADINVDGKVDIKDLCVMIKNFTV